MVKQRQNSRANKTTPKRRQRRNNNNNSGAQGGIATYETPTATSSKIVPLPRELMRGVQDLYPLHLKGVIGMANTGAFSCSAGLALTPQLTGSNSYQGLGTMFPVLNNMRASFTEFMISRVKVHVMCVSPLTGVGFLAFCYEATDSARNALPSTIGDASGVHSAIASPGQPASIIFNATDYNAQWLSTYSAAADQRSEEAGVVQIYGENSSVVSAAAGILNVEVDFFFKGYRV